VRPDVVEAENSTSPRRYLAHDGMPARFYVDSLVHDADALRLLIKLFGAERIAFGSDYPFSLGETHPGRLIESMNLADRENAQLFSGTVREFLRL
jgi:aminocarboxymuconate-semialdehyde decarboxylase